MSFLKWPPHATLFSFLARLHNFVPSLLRALTYHTLIIVEESSVILISYDLKFVVCVSVKLWYDLRNRDTILDQKFRGVIMEILWHDLRIKFNIVPYTNL